MQENVSDFFYRLRCLKKPLAIGEIFFFISNAKLNFEIQKMSLEKSQKQKQTIRFLNLSLPIQSI
jgi:hypothetical protein